MPTCQPPVVALLGSGSCLRLVPAAQECTGAYLPGNPMYAPPIPGHGARPNLFQELWRVGLLDIANFFSIGGFNIYATRYPSQ